MIHFTCKLAANLAPVWASDDYYQKQMFQNIVFTNGLLYDVKIEHYRTPVVNSAIACIANLSKGLAEMKNGNPIFCKENSRSVASAGIEPKFQGTL